MIKHILFNEEKEKLSNIIKLLRSTDEECNILGISLVKEEINLDASCLITSRSGIGDFYVSVKECLHYSAFLAGLLENFCICRYYYLPEN